MAEKKQPYPVDQHYVWRYYLEAWQQANPFFCYRYIDKNIFRTQPKVVANERFFYALSPLSDDDEKFLIAMIEGGQPRI